MNQVLVLNANEMPHDSVGVRHALSMLRRRCARLVQERPGETYRSASGESVPVPSVIALLVYVSIPPKASCRVSNALLFARDGYRCQYCGRHKDDLDGPQGERLSRDHVRPVARFVGATEGERRRKADTWENVVTACSTCNEKKGCRTPSEAGMRLISDKAPRRPTGVLLVVRSRKLDAEQLRFLEDHRLDRFVLIL